MVHARPTVWKVHKFVNGQTAGPWLTCGVQLLKQAVKIPQPFGPGGVLQRLVLRQHVDEAFTQIVAMLFQEFGPLFSQGDDHLPYLGLGANNPTTFDSVTFTLMPTALTGGPLTIKFPQLTAVLYSPSAVPLPASWSSLLFGLVGLGFVAVRGKNKGSGAFAAC